MMMQPSIKPADEGSAGDIIARIGSLTDPNAARQPA